MARERRRPMEPGSAIGRALTRKARPAAEPDSTEAKARQLEADLGGAAEAARRVGVSERTWRRWKAGGTPRGSNATALDRESQENARRKAVAPKRATRMRTKGAYVRMAGSIGGDTPGGRSRYNTRHRTIGERTAIQLTGENMSAILDAWEGGDDAAALDLLRDAIADKWDDFPNLTFENLTMLDFLRDDPTE